MSTTWSYDLFLPLRNKLEQKELNDIAHFLEDTGFSPINPHYGKVLITRVDENSLEIIEQEFSDISQISPSTGVDGSILTIWNRDIDINIGFNLTTDMEGEFLSNNKLIKIPLSRLSILIDNTHFRDDVGVRTTISNSILRLFQNLCDYLSACYGCSYNDETIESFYNDPTLWKKITSGGKPNYLFWINFFSNRYFRHIELGRLISLGGQVVRSKTGFFVFFSNHPWESDLSSLQIINDIWKRI